MSIAPLIFWLFLVVDTLISVFFAVIAVRAFIDCIGRPAQMFEIMGRRTKNFWLAVTAVSMAVCVFSALGAVLPLVLPGYPGGGGTVGILQLIALIASGIYLADVKPAVS